MVDILKTIGIFIILLAFTVISAFVLGAIFFGKAGNVALIRIDGEIGSSSSLLSQTASSEDIIKALEDARDNPDIKAVILEINSPGGTVVASKEISSALKSVHKPKICWLREVAASGAYWVASACDKIVADEFTLTGSIGVTGSYLEFSQLFEKYGISYVRLVSGEEKDVGTPYRAPTDSEKTMMQGMINDIRDSFVSEIAKNRNLSYAYISNISDGSAFTGKQALNYGLVDVLGDKETVYNLTKEMANLTEIKTIVYEKKLSLTELAAGFLGESLAKNILQSQLKLTA